MLRKKCLLILLLLYIFILTSCGNSLSKYPSKEKVLQDIQINVKPIILIENESIPITFENCEVLIDSYNEYNEQLEGFINLVYSERGYKATASYKVLYNLSKNNGWVFQGLNVLSNSTITDTPKIEDISIVYKGRTPEKWILLRYEDIYDKIEFLKSEKIGEEKCRYTFKATTSGIYIEEEVNLSVDFELVNNEKNCFSWEISYENSPYSEEVVNREFNLVGIYEWEDSTLLTHIEITDVIGDTIYFSDNVYQGDHEDLKEGRKYRLNVISKEAKISRERIIDDYYTFEINYRYGEHGAFATIDYRIYPNDMVWSCIEYPNNCRIFTKKDVSDNREPKNDNKYNVALLLNGNLGDKSLYDSANEGLTRLKEGFKDKFDFKVVEMGGTPRDEATWEPTLMKYCDSRKYDIIILGTWLMEGALLNAAEKYPEQKFIFFDEIFEFDEFNARFPVGKAPKNIYNVLYKQNEISFLVGATAVMMTTDSNIEMIDSNNKKIGFLGGMENVVIQNSLNGYIQGAKHIDSDIEISIAYVGNFYDSSSGKDLALAQYNSGVDVGYNVAGGAGLGQIEAAADVSKWAFGVDSDQAVLLPRMSKNIPTSAVKNIGNSLIRAIKLDMEGHL